MSLANAIAAHPRRLLRFEFPVEGSEATKLAGSNFERNRAALERRWPRTIVTLPDALPELEWLFARDGALSARHVDGRWFNDISVPRRSAERMIKQVATAGNTAVQLAPTHACQVRRVLDLLPQTHAVMVVVPGELAAGMIVACEDFSAEITSGRLWLAAGPDWADELKAILEGNDGLTPPQTMIRVPGLNAAVLEHITQPCDALLSTHAKNQKQLLALVHAKSRSPNRPAKRVCVVSSSFELWNDAGQLLGQAAARSSLDCATLDASSPMQSSDLKLGRSLEGCDAVITANVGRADRPGIVPDQVPWLTWATGASVPARLATAKHDRLVIADEAMRTLALAAGWSDEQVSVASEPWHSVARASDAAAVPSIVVDLMPIIVPDVVKEMSSLQLVWDMAERELAQKPLAMRGTVEAFVLACADRVGVPREGFPTAVFAEALVLPVFARELAVELNRLGVPFAIWGDGWDAVPALAARWRGKVRSAEQFAGCLASTSAIIDVWPGVKTHAARRTGLPMVNAWGRPALAVISDVKKPARGTGSARVAFAMDEVVRAASKA